jgi:hypothetical protein
MYKLCGALFAGALLTCASAANATIIGDFELNGSLANTASTGGSVVLTNNGGTLGATGITFAQNDGPSISGLSATSTYTISMAFTLNSLTGTGGTQYVKLIDFSSLTSDEGYYSYGGTFVPYPLPDSTTAVFTAGQPVVLTISHDASGTILGYVGDTLIYDQSDPTNLSNTIINSNPLTFLTDDHVTSQNESSSGFVDYIRIYDTVITPDQATGSGTGGIPEPATWAMMIVGMGLAGAALRRRQASAPA